jgi:hypothetical protein
MPIERWPVRDPARSRAVGFECLLRLLANASDVTGEFKLQVQRTLSALKRTRR